MQLPLHVPTELIGCRDDIHWSQQPERLWSVLRVENFSPSLSTLYLSFGWVVVVDKQASCGHTGDKQSLVQVVSIKLRSDRGHRSQQRYKFAEPWLCKTADGHEAVSRQ